VRIGPIGEKGRRENFACTKSLAKDATSSFKDEVARKGWECVRTQVHVQVDSATYLSTLSP
jgi:hypothetical protein